MQVMPMEQDTLSLIDSLTSSKSEQSFQLQMENKLLKDQVNTLLSQRDKLEAMCGQYDQNLLKLELKQYKLSPVESEYQMVLLNRAYEEADKIDEITRDFVQF